MINCQARCLIARLWVIVIFLVFYCSGADQDHKVITGKTGILFTQLPLEMQLAIVIDSKRPIDVLHRLRMASKTTREACSGNFFIAFVETLARFKNERPKEVALCIATPEAQDYITSKLNYHKIMVHSYQDRIANRLALKMYKKELKFYVKKLIDNIRYDNLTHSEELLKKNQILKMSRVLDYDIYKTAFDQALERMEYLYLEDLITLNVFTDPYYLKMFGSPQAYLNKETDKAISEFNSHIKQTPGKHPVEACCLIISNLVGLGGKPSSKQKKILKKNALFIKRILRIAAEWI